MDKNLLEENILVKLLGKQIVKVVAGGSNGSIIIFHCGENEISLSIRCVWRLENNSQNVVISGWNESNDALMGNLTKEIKALTNDRIEKIEMSDFFDMKIYLASGKTLNVFCDVTPNYEPEYYGENWVICDKSSNQCYGITRNFQIAVSNYT